MIDWVGIINEDMAHCATISCDRKGDIVYEAYGALIPFMVWLDYLVISLGEAYHTCYRKAESGSGVLAECLELVLKIIMFIYGLSIALGKMNGYVNILVGIQLTAAAIFYISVTAIIFVVAVVSPFIKFNRSLRSPIWSGERRGKSFPLCLLSLKSDQYHTIFKYNTPRGQTY